MVALVQLIRIHMRLPHGRWTTQKNFLTFNLLTASRALGGVFACRSEVENVGPGLAHPVLYTVSAGRPGAAVLQHVHAADPVLGGDLLSGDGGQSVRGWAAGFDRGRAG